MPELPKLVIAGIESQSLTAKGGCPRRRRASSAKSKARLTADDTDRNAGDAEIGNTRNQEAENADTETLW